MNQPLTHKEGNHTSWITVNNSDKCSLVSTCNDSTVMLAGNELDTEDRVYSEPFSHLHERTGLDTRATSTDQIAKKPIRRTQNRTAFKDSRAVDKNSENIKNDQVKQDVKLTSDPNNSPEHAGSGGGDFDETPIYRDSSVELDGDGCFSWLPTNKKVSLGDYALPPDKMSDRLKGIPRCGSTEYTDPYETHRVLNISRKESRKSSPACVEDNDSSDVYSLAKSVIDIKPSKQTPVHRTFSGPPGYTDTSASEDYDHLSSWTSKGPQASDTNPSTGIVQTQASERKQSSAPTSPRHVNSSQYEDPWDSKGKQQQFHEICEKAELAAARKTSVPTSPNSPNKTNKMDAYEDAWDTNFKQKQLEEKIQEARRASESRPRGRYEYEEPVPSPHKSVHKMQSNSKISDGIVYSSNYEAPWDSKVKERELEERFSQVGRISGPRSPAGPRSPGSPSPPNFSAPPPPVPQTYEDAWDMRPQSKIISQVTSSNTSPEHRRISDAPPQLPLSPPPVSRGSISESHYFAEPIDSKLPLDIQKFYHGGITRKEAEDLLRIHKEGSYLVRRSETQKNVFSLSLKGVGGIPMHLRISLSHGEYVLGENSQPFLTVPEMVDYYTRHNLPVQNADHIKLLHPISRT